MEDCPELIPEPENILPTDRWRASGTHRSNTVTGETAFVMKYTIRHADGSATIRTVTKEKGETKTEEVKCAKPPVESPKKPIGPPRDLPKDAQWTAKRQITTDEKGIVTTKITYRVTRTDGKQYTQTEEQTGNGPLCVAKGPIEIQDDFVPEEPEEPQLNTTSEEPSVIPPPPQQKETPSRRAQADDFQHTPPPPPVPSAVTVTPVPQEAPPLKPEPIGPPQGLPNGASWKARRECLREAGIVTVTTTYDIIHGGLQYSQTETKVDDGDLEISKTDPVPAPADSENAMATKPISAPVDLPPGAAWKAHRESTQDETGLITMVTTYDITHDGQTFTQKETAIGDDPPTVEKGSPRPAGPGAGLAARPISPPVDLPKGAGWKAKREVLTDQLGISTSTTKYIISVRDPVTRQISEYDQTEVQIGDGDVDIVHKSHVRPLTDDE